MNEFSRLFRDITAVTDLIDQTDYETVIEFVSKVNCEQLQQYEEGISHPGAIPTPTEMSTPTQ